MPTATSATCDIQTWRQRFDAEVLRQFQAKLEIPLRDLPEYQDSAPAPGNWRAVHSRIRWFNERLQDSEQWDHLPQNDRRILDDARRLTRKLVKFWNSVASQMDRDITGGNIFVAQELEQDALSRAGYAPTAFAQARPQAVEPDDDLDKVENYIYLPSGKKVPLDSQAGQREQKTRKRLGADKAAERWNKIVAKREELKIAPKVSGQLRPGQLRTLIESLEAGEHIEAVGLKRRYGQTLSWFKNRAKKLKGDESKKVLRLLNAIK